MYRKDIEKLLNWKVSQNRKPLMITGLRQCGKTYLCKQFGAEYFEDTAYFYFEGNEALSSVFDYDFDVNRILNELSSAVRMKKIIPGKTLVIFDEIQACPKAITSLKYFCEILPELHIIAAGSLLGVSIKRDGFSFPVGKVDRLEMYPMNFEEFLIAEGYEELLRGAKKYPVGTELSAFYTQKFERALKNYYIVGGMPEIVSNWVQNHDYEQIDILQDNILKDYESDFAKYAPKNDFIKLSWIWDSIPKQLAKENNKFVFSHVKEGKRSKELEDALEWLCDTGLVFKLELVTNAELPLSFNADATWFKVYLCDVGLLRRKSNVSATTILEDNELYKNFKGAFTENFVMNELVRQKIKPYFWKSGNTAELDFIFEHKDNIIPLEAKAEIHTRAKSFNLFCSKYQPKIGLRMSMKNAGINHAGSTKVYSLPLYLIWNLGDCILRMTDS